MKTVFREPRPVWLESTIRRETETPEYSFPSGHAWITTVSQLILMLHFRKGKKWMDPLGITIILCTCFSRVYLGVHFPHDVLAGISLGSLCFLERDRFLFFEEKNVNPQQKRRKTVLQILIWITMFAAIFTLERVHVNQQLGLFYALGSIITSITIGQSPVGYLIDTGKRRHFVRVAIGMIPILSLGFIVKILRANNPQSIHVGMFFVGIFLALWSMRLSQLFFSKIGLGKFVPHEEKQEILNKKGN